MFTTYIYRRADQ